MNVFTKILSIELRKTFSYRVNFWLQYFTSVVGEIFVGYLLWHAIYQAQNTDTIGQMSLNQMIQYYIYVAVLVRIIRGAEGFQVSEEIYSGGLTRYLVYPVNYLSFKLASHIAFMALTFVQLVIALFLVINLTPLMKLSDLSVTNTTLALVATITASFFYYFLALAFEYISFWADNVWCFSVMLRFVVGFFSGLLVPLALMPEWLQQGLKYTPFPALGDLPVRLMMGQASLEEFFNGQWALLFWSLPLALAIVLLWRTGTREYTAVGQ